MFFTHWTYDSSLPPPAWQKKSLILKVYWRTELKKRKGKWQMRGSECGKWKVKIFLQQQNKNSTELDDLCDPPYRAPYLFIAEEGGCSWPLAQLWACIHNFVTIQSRPNGLLSFSLRPSLYISNWNHPNN